MTDKRILLFFGGGDTRKGKETLAKIAGRIPRARAARPWAGNRRGPDAAPRAVMGKPGGMGAAMDFETGERASDEALDAIATAVGPRGRELAG